MIFNPGLMDVVFHGAVASEDVAAAVNLAAARNKTSPIIIEINSPGGTIAGMSGILSAVRAARGHGLASRPVVALVREAALSSAYWLACSCDAIVATATATVGSIGVYQRVVDSSAAAAGQGCKVHVVAMGQHKGALVDGVAVSEDALAQLARSMQEPYRQFVEAVSRGRGLSHEQALALADGRDHYAQQALALKLVDAVVPEGHDPLAIAMVLALRLGQKGTAPTITNPPPRPSIKLGQALQHKDLAMMTLDDLNKMDGGPELVAQIEADALAKYKAQTDASATAPTAPSASPTEPPADAKAMAAAFVGMPEFALNCLAQGMSMTAARLAHGDVVHAQLKAAQSELAALKGAATAKGPGPANASGAAHGGGQARGAPILPAALATAPAYQDHTASPQAARARFLSLRDQVAGERKLTLAQAQKQVMLDHPDLHKLAYGL